MYGIKFVLYVLPVFNHNHNYMALLNLIFKQQVCCHREIAGVVAEG